MITHIKVNTEYNGYRKVFYYSQAPFFLRKSFSLVETLRGHLHFYFYLSAQKL